MDKVMSLEDSVRQFVADGSCIFLGAGHEALIPFAVVYELVRQGPRHLTFSAPISDIAGDILIGSGLVDAVRLAWLGNVSGGLGHNFRRAREQGIPHPVTLIDTSNYGMALALQATAMGLSFLPTKTLQGTDLMASRAGFEPFSWHGESLVAVPAFQPDVAFIGVQVADAAGNGRLDGPLGMTREAAMAAREVVLLCERLVPDLFAETPPWQVTVPGFRVNAVVPVRFGFHPSPALGCYGRDTAFFLEYHEKTRTVDGFRSWLDHWVLSGPHEEYLTRLGDERLLRLEREEGIWQ